MKKPFSRKKNVSKTVIKVLILIIIIAGVGVGGYFLNDFLVSKDLRTTIEEKDQYIQENKKFVLVTSKDIHKGETVNKDELITSELLLTDDNYISMDDLDAVAVIDIKAGSPVTKQMISKETISKDTREVEFTAVTLMTNLKIGDVVDIRITYPNGEDYLVLPKKTIKSLFLTGNLFYSWLNEEELLRFSSAMVDAYLISGAKLYAVKYIESNLQEPAIPTYLVRQEVINAMKLNPNIVSVAEKTLSATARASLDERLSTIDPANADKIKQQYSQESMYRQQAVADGLASEVGEMIQNNSSTGVQPDAATQPSSVPESTTPGTQAPTTQAPTTQVPTTQAPVNPGVANTDNPKEGE